MPRSPRSSVGTGPVYEFTTEATVSVYGMNECMNHDEGGPPPHLTSPGCARPHCCHDHYLSSCAYVSCASFSSPSFSSSPFFPDSFATRKCPGHNHTRLLRLWSVLLGYGLCTDYSTWLLACGSMRGQDIIRVSRSTTGRVLTLVMNKGA